MNRLIMILLWLMLPAGLAAQRPVSFSVHVDPQFAWLHSDEEEVEPDGSILHLRAGLQMEYFFQPNYAFAAGVGINNLGGKLLYIDSTAFYSGEDTLFVNPGQSVRQRFQYIDFPLGLKLKTEELGYLTLFLQLGFNPMIRINAYASGDDPFSDRESIGESVKTFNLGYHAGLGVEYRLGGTTALIGGLRWNAGLTDITKNDEANVTHRAVSVHLGIVF